jgi:tetratricopeptide (TPR) repeat protein
MIREETKHEERRALRLVAGLVIAGIAGIALLAGWSAMRDAQAVAVEIAPAERDTLRDTAEHVPVPLPADEIADPLALPAIDRDRDPMAAGLEAWNARDHALAAAYFTAAAEAAPEGARAHYLLGLSLWKAGRADEAVVAMERAAALDGTSIKTWVNLSRIENDRGAFGDALVAARAALALDTENAEALFLEGRSLRNLGHRDEAIDALERSVAIDPANGYAQNLLGLTLLEQGSEDEAAAVLMRAAELVPGVAYVHNNLGMALERSGSMAEAADAYRAAVAASGGHALAAAHLARIEPLVGESETTVAPLVAESHEESSDTPR